MSNNNTSTNKITLINGSTITPLKLDDNQPIRGRRCKIMEYQDMSGYIDRDELDRILDEYVEKNFNNQNINNNENGGI